MPFIQNSLKKTVLAVKLVEDSYKVYFYKPLLIKHPSISAIPNIDLEKT